MARPTTVALLVACALTASLAVAAPARAETSRAQLGVVSRRGLSHALQAAVLRILGERYTVVNLGASNHPRPAEDMQDRIEEAHVDLVLVLAKSGNFLSVRFFVAQNAEAQGIVRLYARGDKLAATTANKLLAATGERAARLSPGVTLDASSERRNGPRNHATTSAELAPRSEAAEDTEDSEAEPDRSEAETERDHEGAGADEASEPANAEGEPAPEADIGLRLLASVGSSMYSAEFRTQDGRRAIQGGTAFALGLGAGLSFGTAAQPHWALQARYMTSIGRQVNEQHQDGVPQKMGLRTHRFEADLGRYLPLGPRWSLTPALGYALRSVMPEVHFQLIPFYTLGGPYVRVQLSTGPLLGSRVGLRLTPEFQWLPQASAIVGGASLSAARFALSGQLAIFARLDTKVDLEVALHESHAYGQASAPEIDDVHRFILASVVWQP